MTDKEALAELEAFTQRQNQYRSLKAALIEHGIHKLQATRMANCLLEIGRTTLEDAFNTDDNTLLRIPNFGKTSLKHLRSIQPQPPPPVTAFAFVDEHGHIHPNSVRSNEETCLIHARNKLGYVIPVKITAA